jgi:hypothetical protein
LEGEINDFILNGTAFRFTIYHLLFTIYYLPFVIYHLVYITNNIKFMDCQVLYELPRAEARG